MNDSITRDELESLAVWLQGVRDLATRLMKELELLSAPLPSRGNRKSKSNPLPQSEIEKLLTGRMAKIIKRH